MIDIIDDTGAGRAWVQYNKRHQCITVFLQGITQSVSDCSFAATLDGLSLALARRDWHNRTPGLPRLPLHTKAQLIEIAKKHKIIAD